MRRALIVSGVLLMGYAVLGAATDGQVGLPGVLLFLVVVLVVHDAVFLPVVLAAGALIGRFAPPAWRATVRLTAVVTVAVAVVGLPLTLGGGTASSEVTAPPSPYDLMWILIVLTVTGLACGRLLRARAERRDRPRLPEAGPGPR
ncbi:hypothetical protein [Actinoplanes sp. NPDC049802]|uniref:hypothetical protein n=1 Tax=Actinoplanes sp. NPDC049802 TaxID=3154742 RepID=UPI00340C4CB9